MPHLLGLLCYRGSITFYIIIARYLGMKYDQSGICVVHKVKAEQLKLTEYQEIYYIHISNKSKH